MINTETPTESLQKAINKIAEQKLEQDLVNFITLMDKSPLRQAFEEIKFDIGNDNSRNLAPLYNIIKWSSYFKDKVKSSLLNKYIETETKLFIEKVENVQNQIDELKDMIPNG